MLTVLVHFVIGVAVVGALLWGSSVMARRLANRGVRLGPGEDALRIVSRHSLTKGSVLVRVSVEDHDILLGASSKGIEQICDLPKTRAAAVTAPAPGGPTALTGLLGAFGRARTKGQPGQGQTATYSLLDCGAPSGFTGALDRAFRHQRGDRNDRAA